MKKKILLTALLVLINLLTGTSVAQNQCSEAEYQTYFADVKTAIDAAKNHPYDMQPCEETSRSDALIMKKEAKKFFKKLLKGKSLPSPIVTFFKIMLTPSEIGTSSESCPVASDETKTAEYQLNQLYIILETDGCLNKEEIILPRLK